MNLFLLLILTNNNLPFQNKNNLVTPRNGELLIAATQDFLTGTFLLTKKDNFLNFAQATQLAATLLAGEDTFMHIEMPEPAILKVFCTFTLKYLRG